MAASNVSFVIRTGPVNAAPFTTNGAGLLGTGQVRQGALNQAFPQARYGESWSATVLSAAQTFQSVGHGASVHSVARYIAYSLSAFGPLAGLAIWMRAPALPRLASSEMALAMLGQAWLV